MSFINRNSVDGKRTLEEDGSKHMTKFIYDSLDGTIYDIALVVLNLYKDIYKVATLKTKLWYVFDGLKWIQSELGPYYKLSENVVDIYKQYMSSEIEKKIAIEQQIEHLDKEGTDHEKSVVKNTLKKIEKTIVKIEKVIMKLKNVVSKESICKECLYLFYDSNFLYTLDTNTNLICFQNGVLDLEKNVLRNGYILDNISIIVNANFELPKTKKEKKEFILLLDEFKAFRDNITSKRQNELVFTMK
jgi:hypothetical protein